MTDSAVRPTAAARGRDAIGVAVLWLTLAAATFAQKFAAPGTGRAISIGVAVVAGAAALGLLLRRLTIRAPVFIGYIALLGVLCLCAALGMGSRISLNSLALLATLLFPYALRLDVPGDWQAFALKSFRVVACAIALIGVAQFPLQFVVGRRIAFPLDLALSRDLLVSGYNNLNTLAYGSTILKANGVFMLEPSMMSQLLALAIIVEMLHFESLFVLGLLAAGMLVTYSGTGLLLLGAVVPFVLLSRRNFMLLIAPAFLIVVAAQFSAQLNLDAFLDRAGEFSSERTSGYARFVSIFHILGQYVVGNDVALFFGRGPGSIAEYFNRQHFEAYDPTWGKLVYEYGLVGTAAYLAFAIGAVARCEAAAALKWALALQFIFLADYLLIPLIHALIAALVIWPSAERRTGA